VETLGRLKNGESRLELWIYKKKEVTIQREAESREVSSSWPSVISLLKREQIFQIV
jgi:uncharacterized protein YabE (DUF348 family)